MTEQQQIQTGADGVIEIDGQKYMRDARERLVPVGAVRPQDQLMDEMVRKVTAHALELSDRVARFRSHTVFDIDNFDELLAGEYGGHRRKSVKGNRTYMTFDGLMKLQVQVSERIAFGPELQVAADLVDECLAEWSRETRDEIRAVVSHAFNVDKEGEVPKAAIFSLLRLDIDDARWKQAMEAVRDAMRVTGSKSYIRIYRRARPDSPWEPVTIDIAKAAA